MLIVVEELADIINMCENHCILHMKNTLHQYTPIGLFLIRFLQFKMWIVIEELANIIKMCGNHCILHMKNTLHPALHGV